MFKLRDFIHLPQLTDAFNQIVASQAGVVIVAGLNPNQSPAAPYGESLLLSGRSAIFDVLTNEILSSEAFTSPKAKAMLVTRNKEAARHIPKIKARLQVEVVSRDDQELQALKTAVDTPVDLLILDQLTSTNLNAAFAAAHAGVRVLTQLDSVLRGNEIVRQVSILGASADLLRYLSWVMAVQRAPTLCPRCRQTIPRNPLTLDRLGNLHPHLVSLLQDKEQTWYQSQAGGCENCEGTGRKGDITIFDIFQAGAAPDAQAIHLSFEEYMLRLAALGHLSVEDLLNFSTDQLRRTYAFLAASEHALVATKAQLNEKKVALETANRVLVQRTKVLISFQDVSQALINSTQLEDLAQKICMYAGELCGGDRVILYYRLPENQNIPVGERAEVLAVRGWDARFLHIRLDERQVFQNISDPEPAPFRPWPPGIPPKLPAVNSSDEAVLLLAGLSVPLITQERLVGRMIIHTTNRARFQPGEVALLKAFANQAALAIQRTELFAELRAKIDQLEKAQGELVQKERLERELELARQVQQSMLPQSFPQFEGYDLAVHSQPARQVGGDFYDVIALNAEQFGIVIADVSDKGMPAALFMALTRSLILAEAHRSLSPRDVLANVNRLLLELGEPGMFVSVFYGVIDISTRQFHYCRAGHDRPLLLRGGEARLLSGQGSVLGMLDDIDLHLSEESELLLPGDRLVLYTDGLVDVLTPQDQFLNLDGLVEFLKLSVGLTPAEICAQTFAHLASWQGEAEQFDDMTLLVLAVS